MVSYLWWGKTVPLNLIHACNCSFQTNNQKSLGVPDSQVRLVTYCVQDDSEVDVHPTKRFEQLIFTAVPALSTRMYCGRSTAFGRSVSFGRIAFRVMGTDRC